MRLTAIDETGIVLLEGDLTVSGALELDIGDSGRLSILVVRKLDPGDRAYRLREQVLCIFGRF